MNYSIIQKFCLFNLKIIAPFRHPNVDIKPQVGKELIIENLTHELT